MRYFAFLTSSYHSLLSVTVVHVVKYHKPIISASQENLYNFDPSVSLFSTTLLFIIWQFQLLSDINCYCMTYFCIVIVKIFALLFSILLHCIVKIFALLFSRLFALYCQDFCMVIFKIFALLLSRFLHCVSTGIVQLNCFNMFIVL